MEIYSLKLKSKTNANVFICSTDNGDFTLHSDVIVKNKIEKGFCEDSLFYESVSESEILIGFNLCVKYISNKLKTEKQIKDYLYKKEYHKPAVDQIVTKLKEYNIINDELYAETYVKTKPNLSKNRIKQKLLNVGVKSEISSEAVEEIDEYSSCLNNANKYLRNKVADKQTIEKLIRRLQGMGYGWDTIKHTLTEIKCNLED